MPELVVTQESAAQEEIVPQEPVMPELAVPQEPIIMSVSTTQEPVTQNNEDNDDVPLTQLFSQIEKKIQGTKKSKITAPMKENDNFKEKLDSLKKELQVARQKNSEESTFDILA